MIGIGSFDAGVLAGIISNFIGNIFEMVFIPEDGFPFFQTELFYLGRETTGAGDKAGYNLNVWAIRVLYYRMGYRNFQESFALFSSFEIWAGAHCYSFRNKRNKCIMDFERKVNSVLPYIQHSCCR